MKTPGLFSKASLAFTEMSIHHRVLSARTHPGIVLALFLTSCSPQTPTPAETSSPQPTQPMKQDLLGKLDSNLVLALKKSRREAPFDQPTLLEPTVVIPASGLVLVDVTGQVTPGLLSQIQSAGGRVISSFPAMKALRAELPAASLEALAAHPDIQFISPAAEATTNTPASAGSVESSSSLSPNSDPP